MKRIVTVTLNPAVDFTVEVDDFTIDAVNRASASRRDPGGKGINVATALSQGGFLPSLTGFLGRDNSSIFTEHFTRNRMEDCFLYVDGATREGIKIVDRKNVITTDINFPGFTLTDGEIAQFSASYSALIEEADFVVLSGSLPKGLPPEMYGTLARTAKDRGAFVAVDTSGAPLKSVIDLGGADLIKPNLDELGEIYDGIDRARDKLAAVDAFYESIQSKIPYIALSMGGEGSRFYSPRGCYTVTTPKIPVKSTVGAGDTYLAGLIAGLARGEEETEALKTATAWAASKLTMYGPGLCKENPPEQYMDQITVSPV
ncbi:MAG: 1-phosphofructokinase family hexose kinase [Spirochaetales bacterium]|nr:1-phosphofructokinase family hexose kinase [Spirochaetales bacterium]